ncbi:hypothetical protein FA13DRAFT_1713733 [Coprinellus micaceus]|uniref:CHAT domain-containing protein n=1 Tax=Coprinellus micaceus TaxID=71717 RepID=A0A4Y7SW85_COPMI|nr:hypothetical protein FA13DRAFT_1713733 [Coprinellus micaceus]
MPNDSDNGIEQSPFNLKDKDIAHTGDINGGFDGASLADKLFLIAIGGEEENRNRVLLTDAGPHRRTLDSTFGLPPGVKALRYVIKFDVGEDIEIASPNYAGLEKDSTRLLAGECKMEVAGEMVNFQWEAALDADALSRQELSERWEALYDRFQQTEHLPDISEAISTLRTVVEMTPDGDENLAAELNNLGISLKCRFQGAGDLSDIAEAISFQTRAVGLTPEGHEDLPSRLDNLGNSFLDRFERTGDLSDVTAAISAQARAVGLTPDGHALLPAILNNLGGSLSRRFEKTGDLGDIAESISQRTRAVQLTPKGHEDLPSMLMNLGNSFVCRFERMGNLGDIAESISLQTRAIQLTPEGHPNLPSVLLSLGNSFQSRFERTDDLSDISEAVSLQARALRLTPPGHAGRPSYLNNLGNSFRSRFQLTHDNSDISQAISLLTEAVDLAPESHADLPSWLNNLGNSLLYRFEHFDDLGDISEAITVQTRAVGLTPEWHADLPGLRSNLGNSYVRRFISTNSLDDVKDGIYNLSEAVRLSPKMHADLPSFFINLAGAWYGFFSLSREHDHLDAAISSCKSAATSTSGNPRTRLDAAIRWAMLSNRWYPTSRNVLSAFGTALDLLALVAGLEQVVRQRYALIGEYGNLPGEAAAAASRFGRPDTALEWLEQGRCLVWGQQSQLRTPLDQLRAHNEALANRVIEVSNLLENVGSSRQHSGNHHILGDEGLLGRRGPQTFAAREAIPGFETFLRPSPCTAILQHLPASGPIVVLNAHEGQCDAIVLRAGFDEVLHIPLPGFTLQKAKRYQRMLAGELRSHGLRLHNVSQTVEPVTGRAAGKYRNKAAHDSSVHVILKGLWDEVVKPILDALGFLKRDKDTTRLLPRIWWCPTGPLSFLPLHAVGVYGGAGAENVTGLCGIVIYSISDGANPKSQERLPDQ